MSDAMAQAVARLMNATDEVPMVAFIGDISRTRFVDIDTLGSVMEILGEARRFIPVRGPALGFDLRVHQIAAALGLNDFEVPPRERTSTGRCLRDPMMIETACMVVSFPPEFAERVDEDGNRIKDKARKAATWEAADPAVAVAAKAEGIPVLCVYRNGACFWIQ